MTFGEEWGFGSNVEVSQQVIDRYLDRGGNFIDTANVYTRGHSEKIIGDHLGRHPARRDRVVIATKFFGNMYPGDPNAGGGGRKAIVNQCEHSLRRLQTGYIDLYWLHAWDKWTPIEETMRALNDLVTAGKVRYIGFSDTPAWKTAEAQMAARFRGWAPIVAIQIEYSLLERTVEGDLIPMASEFGLGVTPWSPLRGGILTGKYTRENAAEARPARGDWVKSLLNGQAFRVVDELTKVARQVGASPANVALAWLQAQPGVSSIIIGARTLEQLDANLAALDVKLAPEHLSALDEVSRPALNFPAAFLRNAGSFAYGGTTVDGETFAATPMAPRNDDERY
jgi:aryl-alcohol dehydrogenase-like predicted oxidoreductase